MKKKLTALALVIVMVAMLFTGLTMAYFTDTDEATNTFTVGSVEIKLDEAPVDPETGKEISGDRVQENQYNTIVPGIEYDKDPIVHNTGKNDAYVRAKVTITEGVAFLPGVNVAAGGTDDYSDVLYIDAFMALINNTLGEGWKIVSHDDALDSVLNGKTDMTFVIEYTKVLKKGEDTTPIFETVGLPAQFGSDDYMPEKFNVTVIAEAIQSEGFYTDDQAFAALDGETFPVVTVNGNDKAAVLKAIEAADAGDIIRLTEDTTIAGYAATEKLVVEKAVIIDLNGKTLTTECGWGGIDLKGGASIVNGTINHTGNTAAIKAFQVDKIENVTINVTETEDKTKGGIVVQNGAGDYIGSIKNVTITGATNGIECYRSTKDPAIGSMENVKINATANGIFLNGAGRIGKITNCEIKGGNIGINAYLANLWHISLNIKDSTISGGSTGIDIWDEGATNTGSTVAFNYDSDTKFTGGRENIKVTLQEEITCTINGETQTTPCDLRIN